MNNWSKKWVEGTAHAVYYDVILDYRVRGKENKHTKVTVSKYPYFTNIIKRIRYSRWNTAKNTLEVLGEFTNQISY